MALTGYIFTSPTSILPYLEHPRIGPTSLLCRSLARKLQCHVIAGYPEALPAAPQPPDVQAAPAPPSLSSAGSSRRVDEQDESDTGPSEMKALEGEGLGVGYNSAMVVGPTGEVIGNYRKTFRFETDKAWAREGQL